MEVLTQVGTELDRWSYNEFTAFRNGSMSQSLCISRRSASRRCGTRAYFLQKDLSPNRPQQASTHLSCGIFDSICSGGPRVIILWGQKLSRGDRRAQRNHTATCPPARLSFRSQPFYTTCDRLATRSNHIVRTACSTPLSMACIIGSPQDFWLLPRNNEIVSSCMHRLSNPNSD